MTFIEREQKFKEDLSKFCKEADQKTLEQFFDYWTEPNKSGTKMRWELEKTWDLKRRLNRWINNDLNWKNGKTTNSTSVKLGTSDARIKALREWGI